MTISIALRNFNLRYSFYIKKIMNQKILIIDFYITEISSEDVFLLMNKIISQINYITR